MKNFHHYSCDIDWFCLMYERECKKNEKKTTQNWDVFKNEEKEEDESRRICSKCEKICNLCSFFLYWSSSSSWLSL